MTPARRRPVEHLYARTDVVDLFASSPDGRWVLVRDANMLASKTAELELKVDNLERELMADGPGG